ncbi:hypothetical protein [Phytohabitans houttuyneae]|uniref:hypothetical protein n=1 Tax=Phytohabitans houttuyneae TaxID=1076126 RepID=UPI0015642C9C|nr:hypothetical protein [Phytohabitans houttuyneae]
MRRFDDFRHDLGVLICRDPLATERSGGWLHDAALSDTEAGLRKLFDFLGSRRPPL